MFLPAFHSGQMHPGHVGYLTVHAGPWEGDTDAGVSGENPEQGGRENDGTATSGGHLIGTSRPQSRGHDGPGGDVVSAVTSGPDEAKSANNNHRLTARGVCPPKWLH